MMRQVATYARFQLALAVLLPVSAHGQKGGGAGGGAGGGGTPVITAPAVIKPAGLSDVLVQPSTTAGRQPSNPYLTLKVDTQRIKFVGVPTTISYVDTMFVPRPIQGYATLFAPAEIAVYIEKAYTTSPTIDDMLRRPDTLVVLADSARVMCEYFGVEFLPLTSASQGGGASPTVIPTRWESGHCTAKFRWRFSDIPGDQVLNVRPVVIDTTYHPCAKVDSTISTGFGRIPNPKAKLGASDSIFGRTGFTAGCAYRPQALASSYLQYAAVAHLLPAIVVGEVAAVYSRPQFGSSRFLKAIGVKHRLSDSLRTVIGADFPVSEIFFRENAARWTTRFRALLATTLPGTTGAGEDIDYGLQIGGLLTGAAASASPVQLGFGGKAGIHAPGGAFAIVYFNTSTLLTSISGLLSK